METAYDDDVKFASVLSAVAFVTALGCKGGDDLSAAEPVVSYAMTQAVLTTKCQPCHGGARPAGRISLISYEGIAPLVKPGSPGESELVQVMRGTPGHKKMPPSGPAVTEEQIKVVEAWIQAGAKQA